MKRILCILLLILFTVAFCGCDENNTVVGVWRTYDISVNIDSPEIPEYLTFVFNSDGTGSGPVGDFARLDYPTFTYTVENDIIHAHTDDNLDIDMKFEIDGDSMTLEYFGYKRTLRRVSE